MKRRNGWRVHHSMDTPSPFVSSRRRGFQVSTLQLEYSRDFDWIGDPRRTGCIQYLYNAHYYSF